MTYFYERPINKAQKEAESISTIERLKEQAKLTTDPHQRLLLAQRVGELVAGLGGSSNKAGDIAMQNILNKGSKMAENKGSLGQIMDQSYQQEASLLRAAQQAKDPQELYKIQGQLQLLQQNRAVAQRDAERKDALLTQMYNLNGAGSAPVLSQQPVGPYDARPGGYGSNGATQAMVDRDSSPSQSQGPKYGTVGQAAQNPFLQASLATDVSEGAQGLVGFDAKNPMHRAVVKGVIENAIQSGKPIDRESLLNNINAKIQNIQEVGVKNKEMQYKNLKIDSDIKKILSEDGKNAKLQGLDEVMARQVRGEARKIFDRVQGLTTIKSIMKPEYLNFFSQTGIRTLSAANRFGVPLSEDNKKAIRAFTRFRTQISQVFNIYRKEITGAQASDKELERLEKAFIHMKMGPEEFKGAIDGLISYGMIDFLLKEKQLENYNDAVDPNYKEKLLDSSFDSQYNSEVDKRLRKELKTWNSTKEWLNSEDSLDELPGVSRDAEGNITAIPDAVSTDKVDTSLGQVDVNQDSLNKINQALSKKLQEAQQQ